VESGLKKTKMNINDLLEECRLKDVFDISEVEFALLETSGKLSVQLNAPHRTLTPQDMNIPTAYKGLCVNLIVDGKVFDAHLKIIGRDLLWLHEELRKQGVANPSKVLLAYLDSSNALHIYLKNNDPPITPVV
jgi:uncharacterized membrane protein YcaP (DUF421 family)